MSTPASALSAAARGTESAGTPGTAEATAKSK
jgi:hypothetical protein